jgi:glycosyltransferase involved in cell wall biosynthesis
MHFHEAVPAHYPVFEDAPSNLALATKMVEVVENYHLDVLHVHYAMPFATSAYLAKQIMLPEQLGVVTTLHGTDITVVGAEPAFFRVTQFSIQSSDRVTAVSRFLKERAEATFGITKPIEVIYNFVDPKVFVPRRKSSIRFGRARDEGPDACFELPSGQRTYRSSFKSSPRSESGSGRSWSVVGDGPEKAGAEQLARELGVHRDVLFLGNQDLMEEMLSLADVFLLPSSSESFGLVALEAMSAEVPVVCSNAGGLPEVVEHGFTGFLHDPQHVAGYTSSVLKLLTNENLRRTMGRRGRRVAIEKFGAEAMIEQYVKVYESLR